MGSICSKHKNKVDEIEKEKDDEKEKDKSSVQLVPPALSPVQLGGVNMDTNGSVNRVLKKYSQANSGLSLNGPSEKVVDGTLTKVQQQKCTKLDTGIGEGKSKMSRILSMTPNAEGEHIAAGWPLWLSSVAGDAIKGWVPRRLDSFEKLGQVSSNISALFFFFASIYPYIYSFWCTFCIRVGYFSSLRAHCFDNYD